MPFLIFFVNVLWFWECNLEIRYFNEAIKKSLYRLKKGQCEFWKELFGWSVCLSVRSNLLDHLAAWERIIIWSSQFLN